MPSRAARKSNVLSHHVDADAGAKCFFEFFVLCHKNIFPDQTSALLLEQNSSNSLNWKGERFYQVNGPSGYSVVQAEGVQAEQHAVSQVHVFLRVAF